MWAEIWPCMPEPGPTRLALRVVGGIFFLKEGRVYPLRKTESEDQRGQVSHPRRHSTEKVGTEFCNPLFTMKPWKSVVSEKDVIPVQSKEGDKSIYVGKVLR